MGFSNTNKSLDSKIEKKMGKLQNWTVEKEIIILKIIPIVIGILGQITDEINFLQELNNLSIIHQ